MAGCCQGTQQRGGGHPRTSRPLAALEAHRDVHAKRVALLEDTWKAVSVMESGNAVEGRVEALGSQLADETQRLVALASVVASAKSLIAEATAQVTAVDALTGDLAKATDSGASPMRTALAGERLRGEDRISHVLYVELNHAGADSQTRRLILGESGHLGFMGSANASWLLLRADDARIVTGGHIAKANRMTYDLATGKATRPTEPEVVPDADLPPDSALGDANWAKGLIVVIALFLIVISVLAIVNLALS